MVTHHLGMNISNLVRFNYLIAIKQLKFDLIQRVELIIQLINWSEIIN